MSADTQRAWYREQMERHAGNVIREMGWAQFASEHGATSIGPFIMSGAHEYNEARLAAHFGRLALGEQDDEALGAQPGSIHSQAYQELIVALKRGEQP